jgi:hypothetical protein
MSQQDVWNSENAEMRRMFAEKDAEIELLRQHDGYVPSHRVAREVGELHAEIERLKAESEMMSEQAVKFRDIAQGYAQLIGELADALENLWPSLSWGSDDSTMGKTRKLIQRAREVTT